MFLLYPTKKRIIGFIYAFFFSLLNMLGFIYQKKIVSDMKDRMILIIGTIILTIIIYNLYYFIKDIIDKYLVKKLFVEKKIEKMPAIKYVLYIFILHFIIYFIVFLAYFPGLFTYDVNFQVVQHLGTYNTHHPIFHTLLLNFFIDFGKKVFGDTTYGIALFSILQIAIASLSFAIMHTFLYKNGSPKICRTICIIFTVFHPVFQILHLSMIKDSIFSSFFLIFILYTYIISEKDDIEYKSDQKYKYVFPYIFSTYLMLSFRHNSMFTMGVYLFILFIYALIFLLKKNIKKCKVISYLLIISMFSFLASFFINKTLTTSLMATVDNEREKYSVPCVQMAYVYNVKNDELTEGEKKEMEHLISAIKGYNPVRADGLKELYSINLDDNFIPTYLKYFIRYPFCYVKAYLLLNQGYYYVLDDTSGSIYGKGKLGEYGGAGYMLTDHHNLCNVRKAPIFKPLNRFYEWMFSENHYQDFLPIHLIMSFGIYLWIILLFFAYSIEEKIVNVPVYGFIIIYILMLTLGPCAIVRYALPYISVVPLICFIYIDKISKSKDMVVISK